MAFRKENPPKALRSFAQWAFHSGVSQGGTVVVGTGASSSSSSDSISMTRRRCFGGSSSESDRVKSIVALRLTVEGVSMAVAVLSVVKLQL